MLGFIDLRLSVCVSASSCKQHPLVIEADIIDQSKLIIRYRLFKFCESPQCLCNLYVEIRAISKNDNVFNNSKHHYIVHNCCCIYYTCESEYKRKVKTTLMDEKLYRELGQLTKDKIIWKQNIPYVASLLKNQSPKITAKAMWLLGEMGLIYPQEVAPYTKEIASFIVSENNLLRERTANALGRIGRADYSVNYGIQRMLLKC